MAPPAIPNQISLRIMVDKQKNKVLFAEARKEFIDILLSFLTLPLGTIARLVSKDTNSKGFTFGSITSLYRSVQNLDPVYFNTDTCKEMLLHPKNPMEVNCRNLKLNIDDTQPTKYLVCENFNCRSKNVPVGTFRTHMCKCGRIMSKEIECDSSIREGQTSEGYVWEWATFVIFDDLTVKAWDQCTTLDVHRILCCEDTPQELIVNFGINEVLDLLKCSLISNSPLTEVFLGKQLFHLVNSKPEMFCWIKDESADNDNTKKVKVKLTHMKSKSKILLAQVGEDFMDLLLSFLTLPLGVVEHVLQGKSSLTCIDKLYTSVVELNTKFFKSQKLKDMIVNPGVAPHYKVNNQILPIDEGKHFECCCYVHKYSGYVDCGDMYLTTTNETIDPCVVYDNVGLYRGYLHATWMDPKAPSTKGETMNSGGYVKADSIFMVTDELVVKPYSFISAVSILNDSKVQDHDLEETIIYIGVREVLSILKASVSSSSALTDLFGPFVKCIKQEKSI